MSPKKNQKSTVGRPPADPPSVVRSTRLEAGIGKAIGALSTAHRRSDSAEIAVAVERYCLDHEETLKKLDAWCDELEALKTQRKRLS